MKESIYMNEQVAILNFSASYVRSTAELLNSPEFRNITEIFIESLKETNRDLYNWILNGKTVREAKVEITRCFRLMSVFECNEIDNYYLNDKDQLLEFIEEFYDFWKHHQRFSITYIGNGQTSTAVNYITNDSNFNRLIRDTYRHIEEKVQGRKNKIPMRNIFLEETCYMNLQHPQFSALNCDKRPSIIVPTRKEHGRCQGKQNRFRERQNDLPKNF